MLKAPLLIPRTYIFLVLKCNCQTYDMNLSQIFQTPRCATLGAYDMFDNKFDQYRPEVCLAIEEISQQGSRTEVCPKTGIIGSKLKGTFFGSMLKLIKFLRYYIYRAYTIIVNLFYGAQTIVDLFTYFRIFSNNIFQNKLMSLYRVYKVIPGNVGQRNKRGSFQHPPILCVKSALQSNCSQRKN